jgi:hypothetical protein
MSDERSTIVAKPAKYLYEAERRLDPGEVDSRWSEADGFTRAFYIECIWALLCRKLLLTRFFERADGNLVTRKSESTKQTDSRSKPQAIILPCAETDLVIALAIHRIVIMSGDVVVECAVVATQDEVR